MEMTLEGIAAFRAGGGTAKEVIAEVFSRIESCPDKAVWIALRSRTEVMDELGSRSPDLPLYGVPFAVKDNIDVSGLPTTAACPDFSYVPGEDAPVVAKLRAAGAVVIGKTNLDQFATGLVGTRSPHGAPRCVFDERYVSGGSSSGSAVAVARGLVAFALGTDTAGSGRVPAAFNNIVGVKPTKGLLSSRGVVPACRSLDCVSIFAATCREALLLRRFAEGFDHADPFSRRSEPRRLPPHPRVGVLSPADQEFFGDEKAAALYRKAMASLGGDAVVIDFAPFREAARLLYDGPWVAERLAALEDTLDRHRDGFDPVIRTIVEGARGKSAVDAFRGLYRLEELERRTGAEWERMDVLLLPTAPTIYGVDAVMADPIRLNSHLGHYTNFVNLLDCCAVAVPAGFTGDGLPFGVTAIAPAFADDDLARFADGLHRRLEPSYGAKRAPLPEALCDERREDGILLAVAGAHLAGQPLHHELAGRGARLVARTRTAPSYRLYALANTVPLKPGLVFDPAFFGPGIEVEVYALGAAAFGSFTAVVPPPLAIGSIRLADQSQVKGFVCEPAALEDAQDITVFGGWRAYLDAVDG